MQHILTEEDVLKIERSENEMTQFMTGVLKEVLHDIDDSFVGFARPDETGRTNETYYKIFYKSKVVWVSFKETIATVGNPGNPKKKVAVDLNKPNSFERLKEAIVGYHKK